MVRSSGLVKRKHTDALVRSSENILSNAERGQVRPKKNWRGVIR